jgi:UDP-N-acetylmuramate dehydrogenase
VNVTEPVRFAAMNTAALRGTLREGVDMARYVSWRAGGRVERMYQPADLTDLAAFVRLLPPGEPVIAVGLGSNLLVRDGGLRGTVILMHGALTELRQEPGGAIYAQAGIAGAKLARFAALNNLRGAEFFAGIPGTLGGMLAMNAGCYGSETWEKVERVQVLGRNGVLHERNAADYEIGYRHVALRAGTEEWFVGAWMRLESGDGEISRREIKNLLARRLASQPLNLPNAGSVFRNPPGDHAARLIEACGLKGRRIGGACISEKHANFIVNMGGATAGDIEELIEQVQATVLENTGVSLHREVRIVGEKA